MLFVCLLFVGALMMMIIITDAACLWLE